jgi:hypothetical protein
LSILSKALCLHLTALLLFDSIPSHVLSKIFPLRQEPHITDLRCYL